MLKRHITTACLFALCLALSGCGDKLLQRSHSSVVPHSAAYWENESADTLRAENYQELVNALLILLGEHSEDGVVRIYGDHPNTAAMAGEACIEVQQETALGAYLLDYITYNGTAESDCYELTVRFGYRRTAEEQAAILNATSTEALPDLLRDAAAERRDAVAIRFGYFATDRAGVMRMVSDVRGELYPVEEERPGEGEPPGEPAESGQSETPEGPDAPPEDEAPPADGVSPAEPAYDIAPWQVLFYPDTDRPGIVEITLAEEGDA